MSWRDNLARRCREAAEAWGIDTEGMSEREIEGYTLPVVETLEGPKAGYRANAVRLVRLNGRWGFCLNVSTAQGGWGYGPVPKFCPPHPTRTAALRAASEALLKRTGRARAHERSAAAAPFTRKVEAWAEGLRRPSLFGEPAA